MAQTGTDKLTTNQRKALNSLLRCSTVSKAALAAGLSERSLWRYLADPGFKAALRARQDQAIMATTAALAGMSGDAVAALHDLLKGADTAGSVKARVGLGWLDQTRKAVQLQDLVQRVEALEEVITGGAE